MSEQIAEARLKAQQQQVGAIRDRLALRARFLTGNYEGRDTVYGVRKLRTAEGIAYAQYLSNSAIDKSVPFVAEGSLGKPGYASQRPA